MRSDHGVPSLPSDRTPPAPRLPTCAGPDGHAKAGRLGSPPPSPPLPPPAPSPPTARRADAIRAAPEGPESPPPTAVGLTHVLRFACPTDLRHFREGGRSDTSRKRCPALLRAIRALCSASPSPPRAGLPPRPRSEGHPPNRPLFLDLAERFAVVSLASATRSARFAPSPP